jgi:LytS/YehU family sensor histidine kinase
MILEALVLIVILLLVFKYRLKKIRKKQTEELKRINLENELRIVQQSALKAQMNPHFIFNVLNSIKGYIYDNDKKNAVLYLSEFSELMRKVLDNSSNERIKLSEEIEILRIYIELEAMLLDGEFSYEIKLEDNIDADSIQIPGLLIQPYVENAFKHGLRHKKDTKKLVLNLSLLEKENILLVEINDDGIGLQRSKQINEQNTKAHKSFASEATAKRIDLLNSEKKDAIHVEMFDKGELHQEQTGTIVKLLILIKK